MIPGGRCLPPVVAPAPPARQGREPFCCTVYRSLLFFNRAHWNILVPYLETSARPSYLASCSRDVPDITTYSGTLMHE